MTGLGYQTLYCRAREAAAQGSPARQFFLDLDKFSDDDLLREVSGLTGDDGARRMGSVRHLRTMFVRRLEDRWRWPALPRTYAIRREALVDVSALFAQCAAAHRLHGSPLGGAFRDFAAGALEHQIEFYAGDQFIRRTVCGPDSWFVFMFAECALACIEQDVDEPWWSELLPSLVLMQLYFAARSGARTSVVAHGRPSAQLAPQQRSMIDRSWSADIDVITAPQRIHQTLREIGVNGFFG